MVKNHVRPGKWISSCLFAFLIFTIGCASVSHVKALREVQDEFSAAAALENELKADPLKADASILLTGPANASYRVVLEDVSRLIAEKRAELESDNLLGTALTLKALAEWRLGEYGAAVRTTSSLSDQNIALLPRDDALMKSLRGLIKNDQAFGHMAMKDKPYQELKTLLTEAAGDIDRGLSTVPRGSGVRTYLILAELAVLKNWLDLFGEAEQFSSEVPGDLRAADEQREWCRVAKPAWQAFVEEMERLDTSAASAAHDRWRQRLGLPAACQ